MTKHYNLFKYLYQSNFIKNCRIISFLSTSIYINNQISYNFNNEEIINVNEIKNYEINKSIKNNINTNILSNIKPYDVHLYELLKKWIRLINRTLYLFILYLPLCLTSPLLLLDNTCISNTWFNSLVYLLSISGPCFIKLGQYVSIRPDLFPLNLCNSLKPLQNNTKTIINNETILLLDNLSRDYNIIIIKDKNDKPLLLGSGCVAQVFKGSISQNSNNKHENIAIKIINPYVKQEIVDDISILLAIAQILDKISIFQYLSILDSMTEFSNLLVNQLDMKIEKSNLKKFHNNFKQKSNYFMKLFNNYDNIKFPKVYDIINEEDILIESYEYGIPMIAMLNEKQEVKHKLAILGLHTIFKMIFEDNFIHADLHPGNILVRQLNNNDYELCLLDAGIVTYLTPIDRKNFIDLFKALILNNGKEVGKLLIERSRKQINVKNPELFIESIDKIVKDINNNKYLHNINISYYLTLVFQLCYKHQVKLESRYVTILLGLGLVEGLGRQLDSNIDILSYALPYVLRAAVIN